jgi:hypothetical protein
MCLVSSIDPQWERFMLVKGISLQRFYGDSYLRRYRDIDIIARQPQDLYELEGLLAESGFTIQAGGVSYPRWIGSGEPFIYVDMARGDPVSPEVELYAGGWPISFRTGISWQELAYHSEILPILASSCRVPTPDWSLLMLVAEQYERFQIRARDLFDMLYLIPNVDLEVVHHLTLKYNLEHLFSRLASALLAITGEFAITRPLASLIFPERRLPKNWVASRSVSHVFPFLAGRYGRRYALINTLTNCLEEYRCYFLRREQHLWLVRLMTLWGQPASLLTRGRYLHLFHINEYKNQWRVEECARGVTLLHTPMGTFVLTANLLESDDDIAAAVRNHGSEG